MKARNIMGTCNYSTKKLNFGLTSLLSVGLFVCMKAKDTYFTKIFHMNTTEENM